MPLPPIYPIVDTQALIRRGRNPVFFAEALLEGGARILQFRHKGHYSRAVFETAKRLSSLCTAAGAAFVINDRADIAALLQAGLHVGQQDLPPALVRRVLPTGLLLGFSTHNEQQLVQGDQEPVDYLALGPIFDTGSKQNADPTVGLERLSSARRLTTKPLVAIGGITLETARSVWNSGADSIAVIGDLMPEEITKMTVRERMEAWLKLK
ncbi:thiamine phosphate synthase [uncultured Paludibaculum sp.]|uniref:thiamine phosphate synthase n=1 Tax=uncultured Paludibaculum sp. TaxID=1765020 RepID=UPI002AAAAC45|nr:thiamine phosphate synthase [uncultured Paludibaculum sp.]